MSGFLLDTDVTSLLYKASASAAFEAWLNEQEAQGAVYLSAVTIHEIEKGIGLLEHKGATAKAASLRIWLSGLADIFSDSILAINAQVAATSGALEALAIASGHAPGAADALIAGTAKHHGLTVVTRNLKHFLPFGLPALTPDHIAP